MSGFVYFVPGEGSSPTPPEILGPSPKSREVLAGPSGGPGKVFSNDSVPQNQMGYWVDGRQVWHQIAGSDSWVGYAKDAPPKEADLKRTDSLQGYLVPLGNGEKWSIPTARTYDDQGNLNYLLPTVVKPNANGEIVSTGDVVLKHRHVWELAEKLNDEYLEPYLNGGGGNLQFSRVFEILQINYQIGPAEIGLLELVDTSNVHTIASCFLDLHKHPSLEDSKKKEVSAT